jgi:hypothetical protein
MSNRQNSLKYGRAFVIAALALVWTAAPANARRPDRWYRMGDDAAENASAGPVGANSATGDTYDSVGQVGNQNLQDLTPVGGPVYVNIAGSRPVPAANGNNWAIQFDGSDDYLFGANLNIPSETDSSVIGVEDYTGLTDRGYQLWAKPTALPATGAAYVLDDADQHEFRVTSTGFWSPETRDDIQVTTTAVALSAWTHLAQVRSGGVAGGSKAWVNGRAVASQTGDYPTSLADLIIGANAEGDGVGGTLAPAAGTFFAGLVDEIDMFVLGGSFGAFNYTSDNGYFTDVFLPSQNAFYSYIDATGPLGSADGHNDKVWVAGDINFDGVKNQADVTAFVAGWRSTNATTIIGAGPKFGDYVTLGKGDLDLDGDTDIDDWMRLRSVFAGAAGISMPTAAQLGLAVPEPSAVTFALLASLGMTFRARRGASAGRNSGGGQPSTGC